MENDKCFKIFFPVGIEIGWLNNNKGTIDEYEWSLHMSLVDLHVRGVDQQVLEQQVWAHPRLRIRGESSRFIIFRFDGLRFSLFVCMIILEFLEHYWVGCKHRLLLAEYLYHHHEGARLLPETGC